MRPGVWPGIAWAVPDGATTCGPAWPWPAAPTPVARRGRRLRLLREYRCGVLRPDDSAVREIEDALRIAERSGDDLAVALARVTLGVALVHRQTAAQRDRGQQLLAEISEVFWLGHPCAIYRSSTSTWRVRGLGVEIAITPYRSCAPPSTTCSARDSCWQWGIPATGVLVETLLDRGADGDVAEAEAAINGWRPRQPTTGLVIREIWLLRMRALLARARGDETRLSRLSGSLPRHGDRRLASRGTWRGPRRCHDGGSAARALPPRLEIVVGPLWGTPCIRENRGRSLAEVECSWRR